MAAPYNLVGRTPGVRWGVPLPPYPDGWFPHRGECQCNECWGPHHQPLAPMCEPVGTVISSGGLFPVLYVKWAECVWWCRVGRQLTFLHMYELIELASEPHTLVEYRPRVDWTNWPDQARYDIWEDERKGRCLPSLEAILGAFKTSDLPRVDMTFTRWSQARGIHK